jgi:hypothetical protein
MTRDPIEELLDGPVAIPDDGFTLRVMAALPPARPAPGVLPGWLVALAAGVAAAALAPDGAALALALADGSATLGGGLARALAAGGGAIPAEAGLAAVGLGVAALAALAAWLAAEPA